MQQITEKFLRKWKEINFVLVNLSLQRPCTRCKWYDSDDCNKTKSKTNKNKQTNQRTKTNKK